MLLYRYFSSHALESLRDSRLKVSRISSFNDPFESRFAYDGEMNRSKAKKIDRRSKDALATHIKRLHPHFNRKEVKAYLKSTQDQRLDTFIKGYRSTEEGAMLEREKIIDEEFRVICFTSSEIEPHHEILMWSHYAGSHKGVRIGFEFPKNSLFSITEIKYAQKRVIVDMSVMAFDPASQSKAISQSVCRKSIGWAYENEHRLFLNPKVCKKGKNADGSSIEFIELQSSWVKRIDLGTRYPEFEKTPLLAVVKEKYPHVECYQAHYHRTDYALEYNKLM
jgi:hypothetical protein